MNIEQKYKETFSEIKVSDEKLKSIEAAMNEKQRVVRNIKFNKLVVVAVATIMVLAMGSVVIASTDIRENIIDGIVSLCKIATLTINGEEVTVEEYTDENGDISENIFSDDKTVIMQGDNEGNITVLTSSDPRNTIAWSVTVDTDLKKIYIFVPKKAELITEVELTTFKEEQCMDITAFDENDYPMYIEFKYEGKNYTVSLLPWDNIWENDGMNVHKVYYDYCGVYWPHVTVDEGTIDEVK